MRVLSKENNRKLDEIRISGLLDFSRLPQSKKTATEEVREIKGENIKSESNQDLIHINHLN